MDRGNPARGRHDALTEYFRVGSFRFPSQLAHQIFKRAECGTRTTAGMSRSAFAQRFKATFGRSAMDFLKELRLQRAAQLLPTTRRPIKSIADHVGFDSRSHFSRSFTDFFGTAPADFRNAPQ